MGTTGCARHGVPFVVRRSRVHAVGLLGLALLAAPACDFSVTNPGPIQDAFLSDPQAFSAVVNGMANAYATALGMDAGGIAKVVSCITREQFPSGNLLDHGCDINEEVGILTPDASHESAAWANAQNARFVAEDGIRRMEGVLGSAANQDAHVASAYMWAGFSNRLLGENMCKAVFDGGPSDTSSAYLTRAKDQFTKALTIATAIGTSQNNVRLAAVAGKASVEVDLGDWSAAETDAASVPYDFNLQIGFDNIGVATYNIFSWAIASAPFRSLSVWNTPYLQYYTDYGDPRTPWKYDAKYPTGELARPCCGKVEFDAEQKYVDVSSPMNIASGREMLLIRAENMLRNGQWSQAMQLVNDSLRATVGVAPWNPTTLDEAWSDFKFERGIELWLEGRRLGDLRRWAAAGTPGALQPLEDPTNPATYLDLNRSLCFPIPTTELQTNPNLQ
jgi:hypothetical protein